MLCSDLIVRTVREKQAVEDGDEEDSEANTYVAEDPESYFEGAEKVSRSAVVDSFATCHGPCC